MLKLCAYYFNMSTRRQNQYGGPHFDYEVDIDFSGVIGRKFSTAIPRRLKAYAIMRKRSVCNGCCAHSPVFRELKRQPVYYCRTVHLV